MTRLIALVFLISPAVVHAESSIDQMAAELSRLRGEVEALSSDIEEKKEAARARMRSLAAQKTSVEAELQREGLRAEQLDQELARIRARIAESEADQTKLEPAIASSVEVLERTVRAGIPFRTEDRIDALLEIGRAVRDRTLAPTVALTRLWTWVEDELRLTRENGIYQQTIEVEGELALATVARLGMVSLYFKTPDERYGAAVKNEAGWAYRVFRDRTDADRTAALFEALEKRVRVGFFELPYAIPEVR